VEPHQPLARDPHLRRPLAHRQLPAGELQQSAQVPVR
jgi:hypothetical protein